VLDYIDLFAGPGGWDTAASIDKMEGVGIEVDPAACRTRRAAGHQTIEADVRKFGPALLPDADGLIASPPCPTFSRAGKGTGRESIPAIIEAVYDMGKNMGHGQYLFEDERTELVLEPLRYALEAVREKKPFNWIAFEQVPEVLPIWEAMGKVLAYYGYSVATDNLFAEQYGVPQTRKRAILVARRKGRAKLPVPTHSRFHNRTPDRLDEGVVPWVSMAEALGWGMTHRPYPTVAAGTKSGGADPAMLGGSGARSSVRRERDEGRWIPGAERLVGFPRRYDGGSGGWVEIDGTKYRARDLRSSRYPAQVVTEKTRSWKAWLKMSAMDRATRRHDGQPAPTLTSGHDWAERRWHVAQIAEAKANNQSGTAFDWAWPLDRPAPVIAGRDLVTNPGANANRFNGSTKSRNDGIRIDQTEAAVLQSFPANYPWQGTKTQQFQQIGNAVPPVLARVVLEAVRSKR
jgi:DNA (cytosine-5)-methyltransferase 1